MHSLYVIYFHTKTYFLNEFESFIHEVYPHFNSVGFNCNYLECVNPKQLTT